MGRMRPAEWVVAFGALLLAAGSFMPWYEGPDVAAAQALRENLGALASDAQIALDMLPDVTFNMWDLSVIPWVGVITFLFAGFLLLGTLFGRTTAPAILSSVPASWSALLLTVMITVRVFDAPFDMVENRYGIYVALTGAVLLWLGGWQSMRDDRTMPAFDNAPEPELVTRAEIDARAAAIGRSSGS